MNDTRPTIHERMVAILDELPAIGKGQWNDQQKFRFRGHDDVLNALNPLLAKHGVFVVPQVVERITDRRTTAKGSVMFEVNLCVDYVFYGASGDYVRASAWGEGTDMGDKATNKAMTMAFKNVLNQTFAISTAETIDADAHTPEETQQARQTPAVTGGQQRPADAAAPPSAEPLKNAEMFKPQATDESLHKLYELTFQLGAKAATEDAVTERRRAGTLTQEWVDRCIATAEKNLKAREAA